MWSNWLNSDGAFNQDQNEHNGLNEQIGHNSYQQNIYPNAAPHIARQHTRGFLPFPSLELPQQFESQTSPRDDQYSEHSANRLPFPSSMQDQANDQDMQDLVYDQLLETQPTKQQINARSRAVELKARLLKERDIRGTSSTPQPSTNRGNVQVLSHMENQSSEPLQASQKAPNSASVSVTEAQFDDLFAQAQAAPFPTAKTHTPAVTRIEATRPPTSKSNVRDIKSNANKTTSLVQADPTGISSKDEEDESEGEIKETPTQAKRILQPSMPSGRPRVTSKPLQTPKTPQKPKVAPSLAGVNTEKNAWENDSRDLSHSKTPQSQGRAQYVKERLEPLDKRRGERRRTDGILPNSLNDDRWERKSALHPQVTYTQSAAEHLNYPSRPEIEHNTHPQNVASFETEKSIPPKTMLSDLTAQDAELRDFLEFTQWNDLTHRLKTLKKGRRQRALAAIEAQKAALLAEEEEEENEEKAEAKPTPKGPSSMFLPNSVASIAAKAATMAPQPFTKTGNDRGSKRNRPDDSAFDDCGGRDHSRGGRDRDIRIKREHDNGARRPNQEDRRFAVDEYLHEDRRGFHNDRQQSCERQASPRFQAWQGRPPARSSDRGGYNGRRGGLGHSVWRQK